MSESEGEGRDGVVMQKKGDGRGDEGNRLRRGIGRSHFLFSRPQCGKAQGGFWVWKSGAVGGGTRSRRGDG